MQKSKLINTLKLFSRDELDALGDFLRSPYFITDVNHHFHSLLFQYIMSFYGNWEHLELSKEQAFKKLFPGQKFLLSRMDKLMTTLLKNIHHFIYLHFKDEEEEQFLETIALIRFFRKRSEYKMTAHYLGKAKKKIETLQLDGSQYYYNHFLLDEELLQQYILEYTNKSSLDYQKFFQTFDIFYLLKKLEQACFFLSLHRYQKPHEVTGIIRLLDAVRPVYREQNILEIPLVKVYYYAYDLLKENKDNEEHYWPLKEMVEQYKNVLPVSAVKVFYGLLRNFLIKRYNQGAQHLSREIFDTHRAHLAEGYLNFDTGILPSVFKNIVALGLQVKEYEWVFEFLHKYRGKIEGAKRSDDVYNYNLAAYYFEIGKYQEALDLLADQYEDITYKISAKRMELKIYYEIKSELLDSKIDAYKVYVFRLSDAQISKLKQTINNNFINVLRQLRNPRTLHSKVRLEKLLQRIEATDLLSEKDWLLAKVKQLLK